MRTTHLSPDEIKNICSGSPTVQAAYAAIEDLFAQKGEVLCEVSFDGLKLDESELNRIGNVPVGQISQIVVMSAFPRTLMNDAAISIADLARSVSANSMKCSEHFRMGDMGPALELFFQITSRIGEIADSAASLRQAYFLWGCAEERISGAQIFTSEWVPNESALLDTSRELFRAFQRRDYISVADVMEYELCGILDKWAQMMSNLKSRDGVHERSSEPAINRTPPLG